jgi:hypothetical protein
MTHLTLMRKFKHCKVSLLLLSKKILIFQHVSCVKLGVGHCFDANPNLDPGSVTGLA